MKASMATVTLVTPVTGTPSDAARAGGEDVLSVLVMAAASVSFAAMMVALTLTDAELIVSWMSEGSTPVNCSDSLILKLSASKSVMSWSMVNSHVTTGL